MAGVTPAAPAERKPRFDGGLLPVVVQDADDGRVLMLAWANAEALDATLSSGQAHFWSRSRDRLWRKGATSGHVIHLDSVEVDCDGDALLYRGRPTGPACHTGAASCFDEEGPAAGVAPSRRRMSLAALERVVASRATAAPEESYTSRLLVGGPGRAATKVVEEAAETAEAALTRGAGAVAEEAADLLYHLLVLLRSRDVPLAAVLDRLAERHAARAQAPPESS
jgi:phosphoribosyl-ATP pyrophosphohydrolase/phosphoribosyl-AMP cyclohydrolase